MGHNHAECGEDPPDEFMTADYSVTFGRGAGEWIEKTIAAWVDVPSHCGLACGKALQGELEKVSRPQKRIGTALRPMRR
jgi:hypothetical protein